MEPVEAPEAEGESRILAPAISPDGRPIPRFRAFTAQVAPPAPSREYRRDPDDATHIDVVPASRQRAIANHRAWQERHSSISNEIIHWLASTGLLGPEVRTAHVANGRAGAARQAARQALEAAKEAQDLAEADLADTVAAYLREARGQLPSGTEAVATRLAIEGAELVAKAVDQAAQAAQRTWGQALGTVNWTEALAQVHLLDTPEAETATVRPAGESVATRRTGRGPAPLDLDGCVYVAVSRDSAGSPTRPPVDDTLISE